MARASTARQQTIAKGPDMLDVGRFAPAVRRRLSAPGLRTFLAIADLWGLDEQQRRLVLGLPSRSTYYNWIKAVREHRAITLDVDVLLRLSAVLGIHQALGVLYPDEGKAISWLNTPNQAMPFAGQPPLRLVTSGTQDGLLTVRRFLDAARGGIYMSPNELDREFLPYSDDDVIFS
ncbi:antitoxin Xre/MbcA/ParS toxin-binding domain-containing protein [Daeguia caeni]|uniref:Antitoxin Xre/MbcA/ParS toxin-binding domain-containing protein n=1 Tax=Daeguia caeni TaxID=439612 RepID=A0ABV9H7B4_9HYPH